MTALGDEIKGQELGLGGDGRYFNKDAAQIIIKLAAGNGFKKVCARLCLVLSTRLAQVYVGQNAYLCTPAMSAVIRRRKLYGAAGRP